MRVRSHVCNLLRAAKYHAPRSTREKHFPMRAQRRTAHLRIACFSKGRCFRVIALLSGCIALLPCECGVAQQVAYCNAVCGSRTRFNVAIWSTPGRQMRPTGRLSSELRIIEVVRSHRLALILGGNVLASFSNVLAVLHSLHWRRCRSQICTYKVNIRVST